MAIEIIKDGRDWIDIGTALLTPTIAIVAAVIAVLQWRIAQNKLKLDLYERRWSIYNVVHKLLSAVMRSGSIKEEEFIDYAKGIYPAQFLFTPEVFTYLNGPFKAKAVELMGLRAETDLDGAARANNAKQTAELRKWMANQYKAVNALFAPHLNLRHW